jgi:hypothetical protein
MDEALITQIEQAIEDASESQGRALSEAFDLWHRASKSSVVAHMRKRVKRIDEVTYYKERMLHYMTQARKELDKV